VTQWTAFVGVTGLVLSLFLALARLSQGTVREGADGARGSPHGDAASTHVAHPANRDSETARPRDPGPNPADSPETHPAAGPESPSDPGEASPPIAATAAGGVERNRHDGPAADLSPGMLLANVALTQGVFGAAVAGAAVYFAIPPAALGLSGAPLSTGLPAVGVGVGFGVVLWIGNELAAAAAESAGVVYDEQLRGMLAPDSAGGWALLLGGALPLVAVVEELLFRAAAVGVPAAAYGASPWALAVVSSLAFALGHGAQGRTGMVVTGALGFALAAGFVFTESLVVVVVAHYLVNALEFLAHEGLGVERPLG